MLDNSKWSSTTSIHSSRPPLPWSKWNMDACAARSSSRSLETGTSTSVGRPDQGWCTAASGTEETVTRDQSNNGRDTDRIEAFSDGVIAVAITLLILDVHVPSVQTGLLQALLRQ